VARFLQYPPTFVDGLLKSNFADVAQLKFIMSFREFPAGGQLSIL
jgi:hypothetical protein